jgi:predicted GNAT superfamily acetyltransferase
MAGPVTHATPIAIREIKDISEMRVVEDLQKQVWGCNDLEVFPSIALIPLVEVGGVLLGAFDGEKMVGFVLGFPGLEDGRPILHSDMLAVKTEYRSHGVGYKLKLAQRERALAKGIDRITWTFDPLQSLNAYLNFAKLGVVSDRYKINYYGDTSSHLHRTGTDRLWVTWLLDSERVKQRLEFDSRSAISAELERIPALVEVGANEEPITRADASFENEAVIEIPRDINAQLRDDVELGVRWRETTRRAFTRAIGDGLSVEDFFRLERMSRPVGAYLLRRKA